MSIVFLDYIDNSNFSEILKEYEERLDAQRRTSRSHL
jgi:hypothetical protein